MRGISKRYGSTVANDGVDFTMYAGEVHALLGENGAGKTTLMNILFGLAPFDAGELSIRGESVRFSSPHDALTHGIGMVHQHFKLVPNFTVAENVVLGSQSSLNLKFDKRAVESEIGAAAEKFGMDVDPAVRVSKMPIEGQQRVEILKLLYRGTKVLILDEPTAALGPAQVKSLFASLERLRDSGHSIVIVTHKMSEVMDMADRVTVLKAGKTMLTQTQGSFDGQSLARAMTGREMKKLPPRRQIPPTKSPALEVNDLVVHGSGELHALSSINFSLQNGEILGVAGVEGNGQSELVDTLAGVTKAAGGTIELAGIDITNATPQTLQKAGLSVIPEDRHGAGLVMGMTIGENLALVDIASGNALKGGFLSPRTIKANAEELMTKYDIRAADPSVPISSLSGGNQQKVVLARQLAQDPKVVVASNPARGLDVGATEYVHRRLLDVRESGNSVLLVSNDLDELLDLSDRVIALYRGEILYAAAVADVSIDELALAMAGTVEGRPASGENAAAAGPR
jgi:simple sugar transport system ATP-binding protein